MTRLTLLLCFFATGALAQNRSMHILLGTPMGTFGESSNKALKPKPGFAIGLDYWVENEKGHIWSLGGTYSAFRRSNEDLKETFEYLTIRAMPIAWNLDNKKRWYFQVGVFGNYLLVQNLQDGGSVVNSTKSIQRTYVGPSAGVGVRLGEAGKSRILFGLRDDFGILGFGKGTPLKFNTITLFAGLEI
jgi:hypothetical protein